LAFTSFIWNVGLSQNSFEGLKVIKAEYDSINRVSLIPADIFEQGADILHLALPLDTTPHNNLVGYEIRWPSICLDGSLVLTITNRQIYLRSSHDNPNPNYLYWFANISDEQYKIIDKKIKADKVLFERVSSEFFLFEQYFYKGFKPEKGNPKKWTNKRIEQHYQNCLQKRYENLGFLISFFDNGLTVDHTIPFMTKEKFEKIKPVRIAFSEDDYEGQNKMTKKAEIEK
jgi:hypothetical protein